MSSIDCQRCSELMDEYFDGLLDAEARAALEAHARSCVSCAAQLAEHRRLLDQMERFRTPRELPEGFHARWVQAVRIEGVNKKRMRRHFGVVAVAAAALVMAVSAGSFIGSGSGNRPANIGAAAATMEIAVRDSGTASQLDTSTQPDTNTKDMLLQGTAASRDNVSDKLFGTSGSGVPENALIFKLVLHVNDVPKTAQELSSLAGLHQFRVDQLSADTYVCAVNSVNRQLIESWVRGYTNEKLPIDETFILQVTITKG